MNYDKVIEEIVRDEDVRNFVRDEFYEVQSIPRQAKRSFGSDRDFEISQYIQKENTRYD